MFQSKFTILLLGLVAMVPAAPLRAQVSLPVQLPSLPALRTDALTRTVDGALDQTEIERLRELRLVRVRDLLRTNRAVLEADPRGALIVRNEVVALSPTEEALDRARAAGFGIGRTRTLDSLGITIVVLQAPQGMSTRRALQHLREADPAGTYDYNHVYLDSGEVGSGEIKPDSASPASAVKVEGSGEVQSHAASSSVKVGLIDGGVQRTHSVFAGLTIHEFGCAGGTIPSAHGTAVASLLVGQSSDFHGAAPNAELFSADVYCGLATGGAVDSVAEAFAWLSREKVPVINISLVGPANVLLERIIQIVIARGHIVVAAVGNDGPSAPPLYPAAYPAVIAVTGVDAKERVLLEACRGKHVDFAAPGANMSAAAVESPFSLVRGTSFAAPIVAGLLAKHVSTLNKEQASAALMSLAAEAKDLGSKGVDKVYGNGLVGNELRPPERLATADRP